MKRTLGRIIPQIFFIIATILFIAVTYLNIQGINSLSEALKWEKHAQEVLIKLDDAFIATINAESSARGFLISADESVLEPYDEARQNIKNEIVHLRELTSDNPNQTERLLRFEKLTDERFSLLKEMIEARRIKSLEDVRAQFFDGRGRELSKNIRVLVGEMKAYENNLYKGRENELNKSLNYTRTVTYVAGFAGILLLGIAALANFSEIGKRRDAEGNLLFANKDLEKRVNERTQELQQKNDELKEQIRQREQSDQYHRVALESGNLGAWRFDAKNNKSEVDERGLSFFGFTSEDFDGSGMNIFSRIHEEDFPLIEKEFQNSLAEKRNFNVEFRVPTSDGLFKWANCTGQPQLDENGDITFIIGNCRDITDGKESEITLRKSENFANAILDSLSAHIAVVDKKGEIVAVNEAWKSFAESNCGTEEDHTSTGIGQNYLEVCRKASDSADEPKLIFENLQRILKGEQKTFSLEYPCHSPTEERWFMLQMNAMDDENGGAVISHINITDRKKAEIEVKNSEQFNRSVFESSPESMMILETNGKLHSINTSGLRLMEIEDFTQLVGKNWIDFWEDEENEIAYQAMQQALKGKNAHFEGFRRTIKGTPKWWEVTVAPVFGADGKPVLLISNARDITERKEAETERERLLKNEKAARKDAEIANRMRDEFLATVSHELRAPLNSILGWGRLLEKGNLDEPTTEKAIKTIVRNAESQNRLIEDLLDVSRIISGKLRLEVMTIKPINIVESALETVRPAAEAKGITLEIKEDSDVSHISGDPNRLQQVIWNLLSNAIKFTPNDGRVTMEIEREDDFVNLRVKDTGVGIKEEFLPHVFDRFSQADASSIRKFGGLGLGLAIVRHITEMHGGTVEVDSEGEGKGATFTVRLPLIIAPEEDDLPKNSEETLFGDKNPNMSLDGLLILIVDDEEDTRQLLVQALTFYGATVVSASSADEALTEIQDKNPDILVSDIGMPDEDGYSLIKKVRNLPDEKQRNTLAVALTAFTRAQDRMRALAAGFQNHVSKPVEPDELVTVIASLTGRLRMEDED